MAFRREHNAIREVCEFRHINCLELLKITGMKAWVSGYQNFGVDDGAR
jgi:hypothetical protein